MAKTSATPHFKCEECGSIVTANNVWKAYDLAEEHIQAHLHDSIKVTDDLGYVWTPEGPYANLRWNQLINA